MKDGVTPLMIAAIVSGKRRVHAARQTPRQPPGPTQRPSHRKPPRMFVQPRNRNLAQAAFSTLALIVGLVQLFTGRRV